MNKIKWFIGRTISALGNRGFFQNIDDVKYLKLIFESHVGYPLNLENPKTFNEKLQWLKLYDHNPEYISMVDKYAVRKVFAEKFGEKYLIPLVGGPWERFEDICFELFPERFVLKCTHDSGSIIICTDKIKFNHQAAKIKLTKHLKRNLFYGGREWVYKSVTPRIIAEKYMTDSLGNEGRKKGLTDYKFFCFDGYVDSVMICINRELDDPKYYFFDMNWNLLRLNNWGKIASEGFTLPKPYCIDEMLNIAKDLSKRIPFLRVDLYECDKKVYFGELTFYPASGFDANLLPETDLYFGDLIHIGGKTE